MDEPKRIKTNAEILLGRKPIPAGKILVVGTDITEKEFETLLSMGKEAEEVTGAGLTESVKDDLTEALKDAVARIEELECIGSERQKDLTAAEELIVKLNAENEALIREKEALTAENTELKAALEAATAAAGDPDGKKDKAKK